MKVMKSIRTRFQGLTDTILRFPVTIILLLSAAVMNAIVISTNEFDYYPRLLFTFLVGASIYAVAQMAYEHYHRGKPYRWLYILFSAVFTVIYFFIIRNDEIATALSIRTIVLLFLLLVAFLWLPSIGSAIDFNISFMAAFKAFWIAGFFSAILFLGIALILGAMNMLIVPIKGTSYAHAANIVFVLYTPLYFLSLIPRYPSMREVSESKGEAQAEGLTEEGEPKGKEMEDLEVIAEKAGTAPGVLASLLTYVIIPVTAIFTIILLVYILMNITGEFWTNSLLEPLLVSYSITVIIVYLLVSRLSSPIATGFSRIFPKILLPVVLFQTVSSCIKIGEVGITHGRYYVILFGFFATVAGLLFCFLPARKNGVIAPILIVLSFLSIIPPVDAFTVSRNNQIRRLEAVLEENNMLVDDGVTPNPDLSDKDQKTIISAIDYLNRMDYTEDISWLSDYSRSYNFDKTFGFSRYENTREDYGTLFLYLDPEIMIDISGYDFLRSTNISAQGNQMREASFLKDGVSYALDYERAGGKTDLVLKKPGEELIRFSVDDIFDRFHTTEKVNYSDEISEEEAEFKVENERAILTLKVRTINIDYWQEGSNWYAELYLMIKIK